MADSKWQTYEEVAAYLLGNFSEHFGLSRVEGKQSIPGVRSGTDWTIDAKGICQGTEAFVIIECRRHTTSKQDQEQLDGLAYRIIDTCAQAGILVSPLGFQSGAEKVAQSEGIVHVELHEDSTPTEFAMRFLNKIFVGIHERCQLSGHCEAELRRVCEKCGEQFPVRANERMCDVCS
ncbi:MAG: hypothetical protein JNM42_12655 [Propionivibrio sp.]|uniref:hypothetical protein n=1 Tax=Propionivibrio sp. TaxID=2212460 RepID=UPI001A38A8F1|nr:hypothetical protein [Propionivibrio sp.]MBL8415280.1 hypothetical protein [Propionivibrio sp.]